MPSSARHASISAALLLSALPLVAEPTPAAPAARFEEALGVGWVAVPTVVRTPNGYVKDLLRSDFEILIDGRPIPIETFDASLDAPVHVVLLQDTSGSMETAGKLAASRELARHLLSEARSADQFAIATFSGGRLSVDVPFTLDHQALEESVDSWEAWGTTALHDAVAWLPTLTADRDGVKRAAVLVTDGLDNASSFDAEAARDLIRQAQLPVYVFGFETGNAYVLGADGRKVFRNADMLNLLARLSGGQYYPLRDPDDLKEAVVKLVEDLRHQYVLGFSVADDGSSAQHRVQVRTRGGRSAVTARTAYRGGNPLAAIRPSGSASKQ